MTWRRHVRSAWGEAVQSTWREYRWWVVAALGITALTLGTWGFHVLPIATTQRWSFWDEFYRSIQLFVLESGSVDPPVPRQLQIARLLAPAVAAYSALGALSVVLRDQLNVVRARLMRKHVLVCGLGRCGLQFARGFLDRGYRVVAIERDQLNPAVEIARKAGVVVLIGDSTNRSLLLKAGVAHACLLVVVCGDDGINLDVTIDVIDVVPPRWGKPVSCFVQIVDAQLRDFLREYSLSTPKRHSVRLEPFDMAERGAPSILAEHPPFGIGGRPGLDRPHMLVVGTGQTGTRLILHACGKWHAAGDEAGRFYITIIDINAGEVIESLNLRFPEFDKICNMEALQMDVESPLFECAEFLEDDSDRPPVSSVYVCLDDDARGIRAGLRLAARLGSEQVPIVVRLTQRSSITSFPRQTGGNGSGLHLFHLVDRTCTPDVMLGGMTEILAQAIHENYVRLERIKGNTAVSNPSMVNWEALPEELRESNRHQADDIGKKLDVIGHAIEPFNEWRDVRFATLTQAEIEFLAEMEHERWCREREANGFTFAPIKDIANKKTPYLVPWEKLSDEMREKDRSMIRRIPDHLATVGFGIVRKASPRNEVDEAKNEPPKRVLPDQV